MSLPQDFWHRKRVLVTGHTGFKGSWLSLWLQMRGATVCGLALSPGTTPDLFTAARVGAGMQSILGDIRDYQTVERVVRDFRPEIVLHLAAQPLVRLSYVEPIATYATNVMGTAHVLEACRVVGGVRAIVNVTTDKCYENKEWLWGYREDERMGGHDPYSNSKGASELVTSAYRDSFFKNSDTALASARAGNVIGGGDWSVDRLIPDILRAFENQQAVTIRHPHSIRPWQHVLEPLAGYLTLAEHLYNHGQAYAEGWNFGPNDDDARPVQWIVERMVDAWGRGATWEIDATRAHPHEAHYLKLDISKAKARLGWTPRWNLQTALAKIISWQSAFLAQEDMHAACIAQIEQYQRHDSLTHFQKDMV